jgi:hypothetical protein
MIEVHWYRYWYLVSKAKVSVNNTDINIIGPKNENYISIKYLITVYIISNVLEVISSSALKLKNGKPYINEYCWIYGSNTDTDTSLNAWDPSIPLLILVSEAKVLVNDTDTIVHICSTTQHTDSVLLPMTPCEPKLTQLSPIKPNQT